MEKHLKRSDIFRENEKFYINRSDENEEYMGVMHDHDFIEICYVISGNGLHVLGNDKYETGSGDLYVINSNFMHGFFPLADKKKPPLVYNCIFTPDFIDSRLFGNSDFKEVTSSIFFQDVVPDSIEAKPYFSFKETQYSEIGEIFEKMHREYRITQKGYSDLIRAYIIELLVKIFRFINEPNDYFNFFQNAPEKHRRIIEKSISFMKKYYSEELTLEQLATNSKISKGHFSRVFKQTTGKNYIDYLLGIRMEEAGRLLRTTEYTINDIAITIGFHDMKHFYSVFKRFFNCTPKQYRDSHH